MLLTSVRSSHRPSDTDRLAALQHYHARETRPDPALDHFAALARHQLNAPMAAISFVDDRYEWFASCVGGDLADVAVEVSAGARVVQGGETVVAGDARADERLAQCPLVAGEPGIRFYAGVPITTPEEYRIGVVAVMDTEARTSDPLPERDAEALHTLARLVMDTLGRQARAVQYEHMLEYTAEGLFAVDAGWRITYANQEAEDLLGGPRTVLLGQNVWDACPEVVEQSFFEPCDRAMRGQRAVTFDALLSPLGARFRVRAAPCAGGLSVHFAEQAEAAETERAETERASSIAAPTDRVLYEMARALLDAPDAPPADMADVTLDALQHLVPHHRASVVLFDDEARVGEIVGVRTPPKASLMTGRRFPLSFFDYLADLEPGEVHYVPDIEALPQTTREKMLRAAGVRAHLSVPLFEGTDIVGTITLGADRVDGFSAEQQDVVQEVARLVAGAIQHGRQRRRLAAAKEKAEDADRLKSVLLANMSHEIRTPLTSIVGFAEVLAEMDLPAVPRRFLRLMQDSSERLLDTLESVLDLSQIEAGALRLDPELFDHAASVHSVIESFETEAEQKGIHLRYERPSEAIEVRMDQTALQRVVTNLISNALKFTPDGGHVAVALRTADETVHLTVADTGVGIEPNFMPRLFEAFQQEESGAAREYGGSGLGLAITRSLVDYMGGEISVESEKGEGATFTVVLPRGLAAGWAGAGQEAR